MTLLPYPWQFPMSARVEQDDLNFYVPRTDPGGPSMDDAVSSIDTSRWARPGCASYVYTQRSYEPFIRDVFDQFSETKTGGAFTFMTGIGGFLQEFLYGYSGLRWGTGAVTLAPTLTAQLAGVVLHDLRWRGRAFTVAVGAARRPSRCSPGRPCRGAPTGRREVSAGTPLTLRTARPDLSPPATWSAAGRPCHQRAAPGRPPLAAVDGSPATDWQPVSLPAMFTTRVSGTRKVGRATVRWGRLWPLVTKPNVPPAPGPVKTVRASDYQLQVSSNGTTWRTVARVTGVNRRVVDHLRFRTVRARYVRLVMTKSSQPPSTPTTQTPNPPPTTPMLEELTVGR